MKDETRSKLAQLLEMDEARAREVQRQKEAEKSAEEQFLDTWRVHRDETVVPSLNDFVDQLEAAGHSARVYAQEQKLGANGRVEQAEEVTLVVVRKGSARDSGWETKIGFTVHPRGRKVFLYYWLANSRGPVGEFAFEEVTADFVEAKTTAWLKALFTGGHRPE